MMGVHHSPRYLEPLDRFGSRTFDGFGGHRHYSSKGNSNLLNIQLPRKPSNIYSVSRNVDAMSRNANVMSRNVDAISRNEYTTTTTTIMAFLSQQGSTEK